MSHTDIFRTQNYTYKRSTVRFLNATCVYEKQNKQQTQSMKDNVVINQ